MKRLRKWWRKGWVAARGLSEAECADDPFVQFERWFADAQRCGLDYPEAMTLATATPDGRPAARMVLCKGVDRRGFQFFTNYDSRKGHELEENAQVALLFYWEPYERQVRIEGAVERLSAEESNAYFRSRPRGHRIGAWASAQSTPLADRTELEAAVTEYELKFKGIDIPLPPFWGGYRCVPESFEFWQGRLNRLHDRLCFTRTPEGWQRFRRAP